MSDAQTLQLEYPPNKTIESMLNLIPDHSTGARLHDLTINKQMAALPGQHKPPSSHQYEPFRRSFYFNWSELPLTRSIEADTGLNSHWWEDWSVALLCQSIYYTNAKVKGLSESKINSAVDQARVTIHQHSYLFYARVLREFPPFEALLGNLKKQEADVDGKSMFREAMLRNVKVWMLWFADGFWKNPDWDLFNNYAKYIALGASESEVDGLIEEMDSMGLPKLASVDKSHWRDYTQYLDGQPAFDHTSIDDTVRGTVLGSYEYMSMGGHLSPPSTITVKNYYSDAFVKKGNPGARFNK
jgi:hypothetical protein